MSEQDRAAGTESFPKLAGVSVWLSRIAVSCVVLVVFVLTYYAWPTADDLCRAAQSPSNWMGNVSHTYFHWSGRWVSHAVEFLVLPSILDPRAYSISLATMEIVFIIALYALARSLLDPRTSRRHLLACVACFWALGFSSMPAPDETLYWFTGGLEYRLSLALAILLFCFSVRITKAPRTYVFLALPLFGPLCLIVAGMHELIGFLLVFVFAALLVARRDLGSAIRAFDLVALGASVAGLLILVAAPGNNVRAATSDNSHEVVRTVFHGVKFVARDVVQWAVVPQLLALSLYLLCNPNLLRLRKELLSARGSPWIRWIPAVTVVFLALGAMLPGWGLGASPNDRTQSLLHSVFLISWFITLLLLISLKPLTVPRLDANSAWLRHAALAAFACALLATGNAERGLRDLDKRIEPWHAAMTVRQGRIEESDPGSALVFSRPPTAPLLMMTRYELTPDPDVWQNKCYAAAHRIASARIETPCEQSLQAGQ